MRSSGRSARAGWVRCITPAMDGCILIPSHQRAYAPARLLRQEHQRRQSVRQAEPSNGYGCSRSRTSTRGSSRSVTREPIMKHLTHALTVLVACLAVVMMAHGAVSQDRAPNGGDKGKPEARTPTYGGGPV